MATYYVNRNAFVNGSGTQESPFNTLAAVLAVVDSNDTVYLSGVFNGETLALTSKHGTRWYQWPIPDSQGATVVARAKIRGITRITSANWTDNTDGSYWATLATVPIGVTYNYGSRLIEDYNGNENRTNSLLKPAVNQAACAATAGTWFHDAGANRLYVNPIPGGAAPTSALSDYSWCKSGNAWVFTTSDNGVIDGIWFEAWIHNAAANGQGVDFQTCDGWTVRNILGRDIGYHLVSFSGNSCSNNTGENIVMHGCAANGGTCIAVYSGGTAVEGCQLRDCEFHLSPTLYYDETVVVPNMGYAGWITHGTGSVGGCKVTRCTSIGYEGTSYPLASCWITTDGGTSPAEDDRQDSNTYEVIVSDSRAINCSRMAVSRPTAHVRCYLDLSKSATFVPSTNAAVTIGNNNVVDALFVSTVIVADTTGITAGAVVRLDANTGGTDTYCTFINCIVANLATTVPTVTGILRRQEADANFVAIQTVFSQAATNNSLRFITGNTTDNSNFSFTDCWYYNIPVAFASGYSPVSGLGTQAQWAAAIDANGIYAVNPGFTSLPTNAEGAGGSELRTSTKIVSPGPEGINRLSYDGRYGAYQYGEESAGLEDQGKHRPTWRRFAV